MQVTTELLTIAIMAAAGAALLAGRSVPRRLVAALVAAALVVVVAPRLWPRRDPPLAVQQAAAKTDDQGYVSSTKCRACHPAQFESWHDSYHRTMTQVATPETVLAPYEPTVVEGRGRRFELDVRDGQLWANDVHPEALFRFILQRKDASAAPPPTLERIEGPVVMTTGSHHMQIYWIKDAQGLFRQLNWVWLVQDQRWVPTEDVYNQPHWGSLGVLGGGGNWAGGCAPCHATAPEARYPRPGRPVADTRVGELGIACEACHGPAEEHVAANRDPLHRYAMHVGDGEDPTIVNPAKLDHVRSAEVCGQCHTVMQTRPTDLDFEKGSSYRPGRDLDAYRVISSLASERDPSMTVYYWPDGTSRSTGREYNALLHSRCYTDGDMDCVSCHSMHASDPDDQLAAGKTGDGACLQCHQEYVGEKAAAHTRHDASSPGARCMNCHMANTTYGLLKLTRSHRVDSPVVKGVDGGERPNACNLCHLDQTLAWTQEKMATWYGTPPSPLSEEETEIPAGLLWLVRGDSIQRATAAWHLGWDEARAALPPRWGAAWLARSLDDPYAAVRYLAGKSLKRMPGYEGLDLDYVEPHGAQGAAVESAMRLAVAHRDGGGDAAERELFDRLRASRNNQPVLLAE